MSMRRLWVLVSRLPPDSATGTALAGGREQADWTPQLRMLAAIHEQLQLGNYLFGAANSDKGKNPVPKPKPIPRPGISAAADKPGRIRFGGKHQSPTGQLQTVLGQPRPHATTGAQG